MFRIRSRFVTLSWSEAMPVVIADASASCNCPFRNNHARLSLPARGVLRKKSLDPEKALPFVTSEHPLQPARNSPKESLYDYLPFLRIWKVIFHPFTHRHKKPAQNSFATVGRSLTGKKLPPEAVDSNVPLEITLFLSS
ncbi:hypothetical protein A0H81_02297 [Grifola frondosa]|uniref:Uncharacterized protein n=1 Tax=Grifola frondosa TaxID=5627 RepID=A0A1C7MKP4_GRIFR|nr:hypothetical protein A0H81_02297 [Grifola frondosa]